MTITVNEELRHIIEPELQSGEKLLWADRPRKFPITIHVLWFGAMMIGYIILFGPLVYSLMFSVSDLQGKFVFLGVLLVFFTLIGLGVKFYTKLLIGPFYEVYGLTNTRAIIISPYKHFQKVSIRAEHMQVFTVLERGGIGTIRLDQIRPRLFSFRIKDRLDTIYSFTTKRSDLSAFHNIANPNEVASLIKENFYEKRESKQQIVSMLKVEKQETSSRRKWAWGMVLLPATYLLLSFCCMKIFGEPQGAFGIINVILTLISMMALIFSPIIALFILILDSIINTRNKRKYRHE